MNVCPACHRRPRLERMPAVLARTGLSRSEIYRRLAAGTFPRGVRLGPRTLAFCSDEIDAWIVEERGKRLPFF